METAVNLWPLIGVAVIAAGFLMRANPMLVVIAACAATGSERLPDADLYVTLEPCAMCAAAISFARVRRLYFGAADEKGGAVVNGPRFFTQATCHHAPETYQGLGELESAQMLKGFFQARRAT